MQKIEPFTAGNYYHVFNRGINGINLFEEKENYEYFLRLYEKHILPVADTFAWVLMPNHFHFLIKLRDTNEMSNPDRVKNPTNPDVILNPTNPVRGENPTNLTGFKNLSGFAPPSQNMSNFFNAYTKAFNKRYTRHGALFERPFKRKAIYSEASLRSVVLYIHNNPVHHEFCTHPAQHSWSSYTTCVSDKPTRLMRSEVIKWFGDMANFEFMHKQKIETEAIEKWLELNT